MLRFPLELPPQKRKPERWGKTIAGALIVLFIMLFLIYVVAPLMEQ